jgi:hypothetical protein
MAASSKPVAAIKAKTKTKPAAKPAARSAAKPVAKSVAKPAQVAKPAASKPAAKKSAGALPPEQRRCYVEVAAYYIAERRGFHGGSEFNDWVAAEAEIDRLLREGILKP